MIQLKALLAGLLVWAFSYSYCSAELNPDFINPNDTDVTQHNIGDDSAASVPLEFGFPFYGTTYYYSWMHSNGVISLVGVNQGAPSSFCCSGVDLSTGTTNITNFIAPLWTDLIQTDQDGGFYTQPIDSDGDGEPDSMRYLWDRIEEFYTTDRENTFGVELFESGKIDMHHELINIQNHAVSIAIKGNDNNQQIGIDYGQNSMSLNNYTNTYSGTPTYDITAQCAANPLYSPECSGYADAYAAYLYQQQCSANPLYDSGCPGYATAYYNQQCSIDPLYDSGCTGYAEAYYTQQCTIDPLYDSGCDGYETAYYNQQCTLDPLYDSGCDGYAAAYLDQQCTLDQLYDTQCPLYEQTYYETYVLPGLNEQIEEASGTNTDVATTTTTQTGGVEVTATGVRDPVASATNVSQTGDATVDEILRGNNDVSTNTVVVDTAPVEMPTTTTREDTTQTEERTEERAEEIIEVASVERENSDERDSESSSNVEERVDDDRNTEDTKSESDGESSSSEGSSNESSEGGDKPKESSGNDGKEKSTKDKIKEKVAEKASQLANNMSKAATIEDQQKIQAQVLALMGFNPDFTAYAGNIIPQPVVYEQEQMPDATIPKNARGLRNGLAQQLLHEKMVDMQYK